MKKNEIKKHVNIAIDNIISEGCTDVSLFRKPFEISLFKDEKFRKEITNEIVSAFDKIINHDGNFETLKMNKIYYMLVPKKNNFDFRKCALIEVLDEIKYLTMACMIAKSVEKERKNKHCVFSYRYEPNGKGCIFNRKYNYSAFKSEYRKISSKKKYKIIIECDISNFYDRLNIHRLNSTLLSIPTLDRKIIEVIDQTLLFWANRDSYGLPVGSNASRILAEAFLIEIDNFLESNGICFCRFVDDYRFFAKDSNEASRIITKFVEILNKHGLSINLSKTKFRDISNYHDTNANSKHTQNKNGLFEIIRGYSGIVPTKFRKLSDSEVAKLKKENEQESFDKLKNNMIVEPADITKTIKILIAKEKFNDLLFFPDILKKYPQFIPYYSDVVKKNKEFISKKTYDSLLNKFSSWLNDNDVPEYILISIISLYNCENYSEKKVLFDFFKNLKRNSGIYIGRAILEQFGDNLTRGEILQIKDYYLRADNWEKRQILKIVLNGLSTSENRPFIKDLKINCSDPFILQMIKKTNWCGQDYNRIFAKSVWMVFLTY